MSDYTEVKQLDDLFKTMDAILRYHRTIFKTKYLAKILEKKSGHFFANHLKHLVEAEYIKREKEETCTYSVNSWEDLGRYKDFISMILNPDFSKTKLERIRQI